LLRDETHLFRPLLETFNIAQSGLFGQIPENFCEDFTEHDWFPEVIANCEVEPLFKPTAFLATVKISLYSGVMKTCLKP
jgi:hypothetical protein